MRRRIIRDREQNIKEFKIIIDHILSNDEFYDGGCTNSEKELLDYAGNGLFLGISQKEIVDMEVKLYKMFRTFKNKHE